MTATTPAHDVDAAVASAAAVAALVEEAGPRVRASALCAAADALDDGADALVALAGAETSLREARLRSELRRTTFQLRFFAGIVEAGEYLEVAIDHADPDWPPAPRPDLRRMLVPLGPALVFTASNFPFAFSVAGGDTAAAIAAGCPVVVKAHSGHPRLSDATAELVSAALEGAGLPPGTLSVVHGRDAGLRAIVDPRVRVASFTGSQEAGRLLFDLAAGRPDPIPFYGELGSLNPVFVTRAALARREEEIAQGYVGSFTLDAGQFCTKPGIVLVPRESSLAERVAGLSGASDGAAMLNDRCRASYCDAVAALGAHESVSVLLAGSVSAGGAVTPSVLATSVEDLVADPEGIVSECFGPATLLVYYDREEQLLEAAESFTGELTATVHAEPGEPILEQLLPRLRGIAGRVLWNGWPTGVAVTWAMQHGGPYPAATARETSVGAAGIGRFLRPVTYQGFPDALLPEALREDNPLGLPRRVDGVLRPATR
ncbi:MAG TPA: aldehyde dehydrogenase (NADP(+)) [Gaiellaceae bacterium]|nr:aldehyde dehydrogenase (NADP(+)) [Gaiellaceae bacterium]